MPAGQRSQFEARQKAPTTIHACGWKSELFAFSAPGDKLRNEQFGYPLATETEGIQRGTVCPAAQDLACKVQCRLSGVKEDDYVLMYITICQIPAWYLADGGASPL